MKTSLINDGWALEVHEDIKTLTDKELLEIARLCNRHLVVVFRDQDLTMEDEYRIVSTVGKVKPNKAESTTSGENLLAAPFIMRVTGEKNEKGEEGLFGHKETLDWHTHHPAQKVRWPYVWLYSVKGSAGSKTSWINMVEAYEGLPDDLKQRVHEITVACGHQNGSFSPSQIFKDHINYDNPQPLVKQNIEGLTGMFFPFLQIFDVIDGATKEEWPELFQRLKDHVTREEFMYHHDWADNDLVISEQHLSIHKRWRFEGMEDRLLHRIAFDYDKAYGDQDETRQG